MAALMTEPTVLSLAGELCVAEVPDARSLIEAAISGGARDLVVDLHEVTLLTAAALRVFATTEARLTALGGALRLRDPLPLPRHVLEITGFDHLVEPSSAV